MIGALAKELGWLLSKVAPEAVAPEWRGAALERLIRECAACSLLGRRQHHYAAAAGKQAGGRNTAHGMRTLCAIVRCAQDDVFAPLDALCSDAGENPAGSCDGSRRRRRPRKRIHSVRQAPPLEQRFEGKLPAGLRVIVVGAGVAGLKAAVELQRAGAEVVVLEGSERLGGRICTQVIGPKGRERPVDLGATFVCGTSRVPPVNPIFRFAVDELGLSLAPKRREGPRANTFYDRSLRPIPQAEVDEAEEMYAEILDAIMEEGERASADEPMASAVARLISERKLSPVQGDIVNSYMSDLYATTMDKISLKGAIAYGYDGLHELVRGGYQQVVDALVQGVTSKAEPRFPVTDIRFKHYVKIVRLTDTGVDCVTDVDGDQRTLNADCAVLTFPLGVLKSGDVEFSPELPRFKREAIEALDMGTENRVAMLFEKVFWPEDVHFLRPVLGRYTFANLHALGVDRVLCAWIRPEAVPQLETWSKEEIMADVERLLKCMFNEAYEAPLAYEVTYWLSNKFSYGSYSFVPVGATQEDFDRLAWPVCGVPDLDEQQAVCKGQLLNAKTRLFFAGEATHKEDAYTVHGAYESGSREANRICHWWSKNHQQLRQGLGDKV
uniref:N1-acetylpolyamine oxidase n=1 Tax=Tetraselmis sp. GSL018 TaxID=582737 RepID=A0A061R8Y1_9CHLO